MHDNLDVVVLSKNLTNYSLDTLDRHSLDSRLNLSIIISTEPLVILNLAEPVVIVDTVLRNVLLHVLLSHINLSLGSTLVNKLPQALLGQFIELVGRLDIGKLLKCWFKPLSLC